MKKLLLAAIAISAIIFLSTEASAQLCNYNKGNAVIRDQNNLCAPSDVDWNIYYYGLDKNKTNEVVINWGDGTAPQVATLVDTTGSGPAAFRKWEVTVSHTYPKDQGYCNYDAMVNLSVNGVQCPAEAIQRQTIIVWDTDNVLGLGLLTDFDEHKVCAGNSANVTFTDVTEFTCLSDEDPNNLGRWIQWEYGTASTITGNVKVGGQNRSFSYAETPVWFDRTAISSNVITQTISVPNTSLTGEFFEVTLHNWNSCNPYEINGVPTGNLPVSKKVYIRIVDAPNANFSINPNPACVNNTLTFNNTSTSGLQYSWDFGDGTTSTTKNPTKTYSVPGNYTVTLTVTNNLITGNTGTCFTTIAKQIDILPQPVASFTINPAAAQCANTAVNVTNTSTNVPAGTGWNWEIRKSSTTGQLVNLNGGNTGGYASTAQDITTSLPYFGTAATATYYIRLIANTPNQCSNTSAWQTMAVKANVGTPAFSAPLIARCQGTGTTQYTATANYASNGYDWAISPAGAGSITNAGLVTWSASFTGTATVQVTAKGCGPDRSATQNVNVTPVVGNPSAIIGAMEICQGTASGMYTTSASSATSYTWTITGAGNTIAGTTTSATVNWAPNFTGDAIITVVAQGCNSSSAPLSTTIKVKPTPQLSNPASDYALIICSGDTATFTPVSLLNGSSFKWTTTIEGAITGVTDVGDNKLIGTDNISDVLTNSGTTSGKVTYHIIPFKDGCEGALKDFTVIVMPGKPDDAGEIAGTNELCEEETGIDYNVPSIPNAVKYVWTLPAGATITAGANTRSIEVDFTNTAPGNHVISVYGENSCGAGQSAAYSLTIKPKPVLTATAVTTVLCHQEEAVITLGSNLPNTNYSWRVISKGSNISGASDASNQNTNELRQQLSNSGSTSQNITYRITPTLNGCEGNSQDITFTVHPSPDVTINAAATILCDGNQTDITLSSAVAGTTFSWTAIADDPVSLTGASNGNGNEIKQTLINNSNVAQKVTYTVTPTANNCTGTSKQIEITVQPTPLVNTVVVSNILCSGQEANISLSGNVTGTTYAWVVSAGTGIGGAQSGSGNLIQQTLTNSTNTPQTVTYTITPSANGCNGASKDVAITVNPKPSLQVTATASLLCSENQTNINLSSNVSGTAFSWTFTASDPAKITGAAAGTGNSILQTLTNTSNTVQSVTYQITTEANGCAGESKDITITVNPTPVLTLQAANTALCSEEKAIINFSSSVSGTTYVWTVQVSNPATLTGAFAGSGTNISQTLTNTGIVQEQVIYRVTPTANGCVGETKQITITINPPVSQANAGPDDATCGLVYTLAANTPDVGTGKWNLESGASTASFADDTDPNTTVTVSDFGSYAFRWTITNGACGSDIDYVTLLFKDAPVTPNISGKTEVCVNAQNVLYQISFRSGSTYAWSLEPALNAPSVKFGGGLNDNLISLDFGSNEWSGELIVVETNNGCTGQPKKLTINAYQLPVADAGADQTICQGSDTTLGGTPAATGGSGNYTYLWSPTTGLNDATLANPTATPAFTRTYTLRVTDANTGCVSVQDNITITVEPQLQAGTIGADQIICEGTVPAAFTQTEASGGNNQPQYQWQRKINNGNFVDIEGEAAKNADYIETDTLAIVNNAITTYTYIRRVEAGVCGIKFTEPFKITVEPALQAGSIGTDQIIVAGSVPDKLTNEVSAQGGNGGLQYQWQKAIGTATNFTNIMGARDAEYQPGAVSTTTFFRRVVSGGACLPIESNVVTITVEAASEAGTIGYDQIICINSKPGAIVEVDPAGGGTGSYDYRWLFSENGTDFTVIPGETGNNYTPATPLDTTTYYKREVRSGVAGSWVSSNVITVTVEPYLNPGIISGNQTICQGGNPVAFSVPEAASGGSGNYSYQWKSSQDSITFTTISGAVSALYKAPAGLTETTYYAREVSGGECPAALSNILKVTVEPTLTGGAIAGIQTVCYEGDPYAFTHEADPQGGTGSYTYQWQSKVANGNFADIVGEDSTIYDVPSGIQYTTTFRRKVMSGVCAAAYSNEIIVKVEPTLNPGSIAGEQVVCENGDPATITSIAPASGAAGPGTYQYQWESSNDIDGKFEIIPGAVSPSYNPPAGITDTTYFIRKVWSGSCGPDSTNIITVFVQPTLSAGSIKGDTTICRGEIPAKFGSVKAAGGGDNNYKYQWQWSYNQGGPYADILNATDSTYQVGTPPSATTYYVRKVTAGFCNPVLSNEIKVTVDPVINPGSIGGQQTICQGESTAFGQNPASGGDGNPKYQWQVKYEGASDFVDIENAISAAYAVSEPMSLSAQFRRRVRAGVCEEKYTNVIPVTVHPTVTAGSIGNDQIIPAYTAPQPFKELAKATGGNNIYNYQWKSSENINGPYANIFGAQDTTYQAGTLTKTTYFVRQVQSGECPPLNSDTITVTIEPNAAAGEIGYSQTICEGSVPADLVELTPASGGNDQYDYQWQWSLDPYNGFTNINGAWDKELVFAPTDTLTITTYYRREVISGVNPAVYTTPVKITVQPTLQAGKVKGDQTICQYGDPTIFSEEDAASGGAGPNTYQYQWKYSTDPDSNRSYIDIPLATNRLYDVQAGTLTQTTYYVREVSSGVCKSVLSNPITVTVDSTLTAGEITGTQTICENTVPEPFSQKEAKGGNKNYQYQWQRKIGNDVFIDIAGNAAAYTESQPLQAVNGQITKYYYRRKVSGGVCGEKYTNNIEVTVEPALYAGEIAGSDTICAGGNTRKFTSVSLATGANGQYAYQWLSATQPNGPFTIIPNAKDITYDAPDTLQQDMYYAREVRSGTCLQIDTSNVVKITVQPTLTAGSIRGNQSIPINGYPEPFENDIEATGGAEPPHDYQWQSSLSRNSNYEDIPGAKSKDYQHNSPLTQTTYFRRKVVSEVCGVANTDPIEVVVQSTLTAGEIGYNQVICEGSTPEYLEETTPATGGAGPGTYKYQWKYATNPNKPFENIEDGSVEDAMARELKFVQGLTDTTYFIREVSSGVYPAVATEEKVTIIVQPELLPGSVDVEAGGLTEICFGEQPGRFVEASQAKGGDGSYEYQWLSSTTSGGSYTEIQDATAPDYQAPAGLASTTYFVRRVRSGFCDDVFSNELTVIVNPLPVVSLSSSITNNVICSGTEITFTASGAATYEFYLNGISVQGASASNTYTSSTLVHMDEVYVLGTDAKGCQSLSNSITTIVNELPTATIAGSTDICAGSQTSLVLNMTGKMPFEVVYTDGTDVLTLRNLAYEALINVKPTVSTTYSLISVKDANGCGQSITGQQAVVGVEYAVAKFSTASDLSGCSPHTMTFVNEDIRPGVTYTWIWGDGSDDGVTTSADTAAIAHTFINYSNNSTMNYQVTLVATNDALGCSSMQMMAVKVYPTLELRVEKDKDSGCAPLQVNFMNNSLGVKYHQWYYRIKGTTDKLEPKTDKSTAFLLQNHTPETIIYEVVYEAGTDDCNATPLTYEIVVHPELNPLFNASPTQQNLPNSTVNITNQTNAGDWEYLWDFGDGATSTAKEPGSHTYDTYGEFLIKLTVSNEGCTQQYEQRVVIDINPDLPFVEFSVDRYEGCGPLTITFSNASNYVDPASFRWDFGDNTGLSSAESPVHTYNQAGQYSASLKARNIFGEEVSVTKEFLVEVYGQPQAIFSAGPSLVYLPDRPISTQNQSVGAVSYRWDFGDGNTSTAFEPVHYYKEEGVYDIMLVAFNDKGCSDTLLIEKAVTVEKPKLAKTRIPNSFTPDPSGPNGGHYQLGDDSNNIFIPVTDGVIEFSMAIYNRWGKLLFTSRDKNIGWDGYYEGRLCPADVYVYKLEMKFINGERITKIGDVSLIR